MAAKFYQDVEGSKRVHQTGDNAKAIAEIESAKGMTPAVKAAAIAALKADKGAVSIKIREGIPGAAKDGGTLPPQLFIEGTGWKPGNTSPRLLQAIVGTDESVAFFREYLATVWQQHVES